MKMSYRSLALLLAALLTLTAWLPAAALADEGDAGGAPQPVGSAPQPQPGGTGDASAGETPVAETPPPAATATPAGPVVTVEVNTPPPDTRTTMSNLPSTPATVRGWRTTSFRVSRPK